MRGGSAVENQGNALSRVLIGGPFLEAEDALLVQEVENRALIHARYSMSIVCAALVLMPLWFGGNTPVVQQLVGALVYAGCICGAVFFLMDRFPLLFEMSFGAASRGLLGVVAATVVLFLFQILPLPIAIIEMLSSATGEAYRVLGATWGTFSLEPARSLQQSLWFIACSLCCFWIVALPHRRRQLLASSARRRSAHRDPRFARLRELDWVVDMLQRAIVVAAVLCSVVALAHWAVGAEALYGMFESQYARLSHTRAHWPFVNSNHLAVLIEMGVFVSLFRLHRLSQISLLKTSREREESGFLHFLMNPNRYGALLQYSLGLFLMTLAMVLSLSRAGNILTLLGAMALWSYLSRYGSVVAAGGSSRSERRTVSAAPRGGRRDRRFWRVLRRFREPMLFLGALVLVLFFIGQGGRELAAERIEYGLQANFDAVRLLLNQLSFQVAMTYSFVGVGLGCWHLAAASMAPQALAGYELDFAHNEYAQFIAETGIVGVLLLLSFVVLLLRAFLRSTAGAVGRVEKTEIVSMLFVVAIPALHFGVDFPMHIPGIAFCFSAALACFLRLLDAALEPNSSNT